MRTWKQSTFLGILAILVFIVVLVACGNDHTHNFGTIWKSDETQHWYECDCGEKADVANHTWGDWTQKEAPTITTEGEKTRTCSVCEKTETQSIDKLIACDCDPKWHFVDEPCCEGVDCECDKTVAGQRLENGILIFNPDNVADFDTMVTRFIDACNHSDITDSQRTWIENNFVKVEIIVSDGDIFSWQVSFSNNILTIKSGTAWSTIKDYIEEWFYDNEIE